jgi:hypothetical protein
MVSPFNREIPSGAPLKKNSEAHLFLLRHDADDVNNTF